MNNPVRALVQRRYEAKLMARLGAPVKGETVLEIGCGCGVGTEVIFNSFGTTKVHAFDIDPSGLHPGESRFKPSWQGSNLRAFDHEDRQSHDVDANTAHVFESRLRRGILVYELDRDCPAYTIHSKSIGREPKFAAG